MALDTKPVFGYGAVEMTPGPRSGRSGAPSGVGSLGSMGSISSDNPTVQWFKAQFGADLTEQEINGVISDIARAIQNGLPPEKIPQITNLPPGAIEGLYDAIAAQQGKSADSVREAYEQQRAADMAAIQSLGAGVVVGATGGMISPTSRQQLVSMRADAQGEVAHEGALLRERTENAGMHVPLAALGTLAPNINTGVQRDRGMGAAIA